MKDLRVGIVGDSLGPGLNEANANQSCILAGVLNGRVVTCNELGRALLRKEGNYLIFNSRRFSKGPLVLSAVHGTLFYIILKFMERKFDVTYLVGGVDSAFLKYLDLRKCVLVLNTIPFNDSDRAVRMFKKRFTPKLAGIIAQGRSLQTRLVDMDVAPGKVHLVYPWVDLERFKCAEPPAADEFRLLFASAPTVEKAGEDNFESKGVSLLLDSLKELSKWHKVSLFMFWRGKYNGRLHEKINVAGLKSRIKVIDRVADMPLFYNNCHATVIPFKNLRRSPEIPLSAVESLACGRPVISTDVPEISSIIQTYNCGSVGEPVTGGFVQAIKECILRYRSLQKNCRSTAEELFAFELSRFTQIHTVMGLTQKGT